MVAGTRHEMADGGAARLDPASLHALSRFLLWERRQAGPAEGGRRCAEERPRGQSEADRLTQQHQVVAVYELRLVHVPELRLDLARGGAQDAARLLRVVVHQPA